MFLNHVYNFHPGQRILRCFRGALMAASDVIVIGGAPFAWKTMLAKQLAAQTGYALVAIDDLSTALCAVTTPQSYSAPHLMAGWDYRANYVAHPLATVIDHSMREHQPTR
jgi:hypothetical protein